MKVAIIGTGVYSMAIAIQLAKKDNEIVMWSESIDRVNEFISTHKIDGILDNITIPDNIRVSNDYEDVLNGAKVVFLATVAKYIGSVCESIKPYITSDMHFCIASKGIENESCKFLSDIVIDSLGIDRVSVISGPTFAIDIAMNEPSALSIASSNLDTINAIKDVLDNDTVKLRETDDMIGIQLCGSIKNVIAIASGMLSGMGYEDSTRAFLITESLHDIKSLIKALKGDEKTILSYAGVGDLMLTANSIKSRNFSFGYIVGHGATKDEIQDYLKENTVEGYYTLMSIRKLVNDNNIELPIIDLIYDILLNDKDCHSLVDFLINKK